MSGNHNRGPGPVPARWMHCPRKAAATIVNKFLAFKTPLSSAFDDQVPEECRFTPEMLFNSMKSHEVKIGLWIDLTNTNRFYSEETVKRNNCKYLKLSCRGHGETPSSQQTNLFIHVCDKFIRENPLEIIGIHCTHGFNRTGFLIVSYLVEKMDWSVEAAINAFARVRNPGIYKPDYLQELLKRYDPDGEPFHAPDLPDWCKEYDDSVDDDDTSSVHNGKASGSGQRRRKEFKHKNPTFMEGVPGVTPVTSDEVVSRIQKIVQSFCRWESSGFPGCQPVSMDTSNIKLLQEKPYSVSWKADGTRYMLLILKENEIYCIDRDNSIFQVSKLRFPQRENLNKHLINTLLDGEMVIDKVNGQNIPRYLAYDIITFEGNNVGELDFSPTRLAYIRKEIVDARHRAMKEGLINRANEPFSVRLKDFWDITQTASLLSEKFAKSLSHEPDGLIFQPSKDTYVAGQCVNVLKWKPYSHNSVDFKLKIITESGMGILPRKIGALYVGGVDRPFGKIKLDKTLRELDNKIIECRFDANKWEFMRERTDKSFPNSFRTAEGVCKSIIDPVTPERLLRFIEENRWRQSDRDMMPPPKKVMRR